MVALSLLRQRCKSYARVILPVATFAETSGTYVNAEGRWQSFPGASKPFGAARPAWKVLRVLGNLCGLSGFDYVASEEVLAEVQGRLRRRRAGQYGGFDLAGR